MPLVYCEPVYILANVLNNCVWIQSIITVS